MSFVVSGSPDPVRGRPARLGLRPESSRGAEGGPGGLRRVSTGSMADSMGWLVVMLWLAVVVAAFVWGSTLALVVV